MRARDRGCGAAQDPTAGACPRAGLISGRGPYLGLKGASFQTSSGPLSFRAGGRYELRVGQVQASVEFNRRTTVLGAPTFAS